MNSLRGETSMHRVILSSLIERRDRRISEGIEWRNIQALIDKVQEDIIERGSREFLIVE